MKANETTLEDLLEGKKRYLIPLYQRTYAWKQANLKQLWDDLLQLVEHRRTKPNATHFLGSMVFAPTTDLGPASGHTYIVVDGQQRLTTLTLLLAAIRDHRADHEDPSHRDRINEQHLLLKWREGQPTKLLPTQADQDSYLACIYGTARAGGADGIGTTYTYFRSRLLEADDPDEPHDIARIEEAVLDGLAIVTITSEPGDNVHRIFESLNNTGLKLSQADLLRNYIFMRLPLLGAAVYRDVWLPLQQQLTAEEMELLFWIDLTQSSPTAQQGDVYQLQQQRLEAMHSEAEIEKEVFRFAALGKLLHLALHPDQESDPQVRRELKRLQEWGSVTAYPVIIHLLHRRSIGDADNAQTARALQYMLSFFIRRILIGQATKNMNRILLAAVPAIAESSPVDVALQRYFSSGRKAWATDDQLREAVTTANLYWSGRAPQKKMLFRWIEETNESNEPVLPDKLSIEHIAPQTITDEWRQELAAGLAPGEDVDSVHQRLLHTLGNLTLTGYNPQMSNKPFADKKQWLQTSALRMNHEIAARPHWTRDEILARSARLADRIINEWPGPDPAFVEQAEPFTNPLWARLTEALLAIPAGAWTSYGDLAALLGTHQVPLGTRLGTHEDPNAYRVLRADGTTSPEFRWLNDEHEGDPKDVLESEGIQFDELGRASQSQRLSAEDLAHLLGWDTADIIGEITDLPLSDSVDRRDRFVALLSAKQAPATVHATLELLNWWVEIGGSLEYGAAEETSCFLMARPAQDPRGSLWPFAIYPSTKVEVVFQHLAVRPPFDDLAACMELMQRLNLASGVELPQAKINLRPGFPLSVLADPGARAVVESALSWCLATARDALHE